jgi:flagellin-like hook-associated protein FlgL
MAPLTLGSNIASLDAQRRLAESTTALSGTFTRLSSGLRNNKASDDAAGLSVAAGLDADIHVYQQGVRNLNDGLSFLAIADDATEQLGSVVTRMRELATESANGTLGNTQRQALDKEAGELSKEYTRIVNTATFNGKAIFNPGATVSLQSGYGSEVLRIALGDKLARRVADGTFKAHQDYSVGGAPEDVALGDLNNDGNQDIIASVGSGVSTILGIGDGTFQSSQHFVTGPYGVHGLGLGDFNGDGTIDAAGGGEFAQVQVLQGNGDGTLGAQANYGTNDGHDQQLVSSDLNGDGNVDLATVNDGYGGALPASVSVLIANGDGTFKAAVNYGVGGGAGSVASADVDGDGMPDLVTADYS